MVRVEFVDSAPAVWRELEIQGSLTLNQTHQVRQAGFGWEGARAPFTPEDP